MVDNYLVYLRVVSPPKEGLFLCRNLLSNLITTQDDHLQINVSVQRLNVNVALGVLRWNLPLFEFYFLIMLNLVLKKM